MCAPSGANSKATYWVFFQWLHEKSIPKDQSTILCHLGLLLRAEGKRERKEKEQGRLFMRSDRKDYFALFSTERGNALILPFRIRLYHSKFLVYYPALCE